jgi:hypothetical protein
MGVHDKPQVLTVPDNVGNVGGTQFARRETGGANIFDEWRQGRFPDMIHAALNDGQGRTDVSAPLGLNSATDTPTVDEKEPTVLQTNHKQALTSGLDDRASSASGRMRADDVINSHSHL